MSPASYTFLPWTRRGLGAHADGASSVTASIAFVGGRSASIELPLAGPGDVVGFDVRAVSRTWPAPDTGEAEPNMFPLIEFDQPDLPWRFSPVAARPDRITPWLALLVVTDDEIASALPATGTRPLPAVSLVGVALPRLDQAWAWAHVQVTATEGLTDDALAALLRSGSPQVVARLLCPRRLRPRTRYRALLVPTHEVGRLAGLGQSIEGIDPLSLAWAIDADAIDLPIYHSWTFSTADGGDFEELVGRLKPITAVPGAGGLPIDVGDPGANLPAASAAPMILEGALSPPGFVSAPWPAAERAAFVPALAELLGRPAQLLASGVGPRVVAPPLYADQQAGEDRLRDGETPHWFQDVNSDPRLRIAAGVGAEVIRREQRDLVAAAWEQVPGVTEVNDTLRGAMLGREVLLRLHRRHLGSTGAEPIVQITAPLHARMLASPTTVAHRIGASPVPPGASSAALRRFARPLGPLARRQGGDARSESTLLTRLGNAELDAAPPPPPPAEIASDRRLGEALVPASVTPESIESKRRLGVVVLAGGVVGLALAVVALVVSLALAAIVATLAVGAVATAAVIRSRETMESHAVAVRDGAITPGIIERTAPAADFGPVSAFRDAAVDMLSAQQSSVVPAPQPPETLAVPSLSATIMNALDPRASMHAAFADRLRVADVLDWRPADPLEPVVVGPELTRPMYEPLAALSPRWLLPGIADVERNRVTLLQTNSRFVEAYMLGLNHEMGRELLWREFPTDPRKTFFRRFWDTRGATRQLGPPDITAVHTWDATSHLGEHAPAGQFDEPLVLLVRGDVIHRYPHLDVEAARATWRDGRREPAGEIRRPIFHGSLAPDIAFYGFALSYDDAIGAATAPGVGDPGWFFALAERPGEPRFGLDEQAASAGAPREWSQLAWSHLVGPSGDPAALEYVDLDTPNPDTRSIASPGGARWHADSGLGPVGARGSDLAYITLQLPFRVAFHAADLLPERDD